VYVKGEGIVLNEPSVVAVEKATNKIKGIGLEAKRMLGRTPEGVTAVRPLKDGVIADVDVTEIMLRYFLTTVTSKRFLKLKPTMVVGVPSGITELERRAVRSSAHAAGAKEVYMVAEPMAAAIGVGLPVETPTGNMVIDIGGGTTEIAVIALSGIVCDTSIRVGGDEIDNAIVTFLRKNYNLMIGEATAEAVKIQIGSAFSTGEEREMDVKGATSSPASRRRCACTRRRSASASRSRSRPSWKPVRRALEITPPELASDIVDRGIVMTGGGALIRGPRRADRARDEPADPRGRGAAHLRGARRRAHPGRRAEVQRSVDDVSSFRPYLKGAGERGRKRDLGIAAGFTALALLLFNLPDTYRTGPGDGGAQHRALSRDRHAGRRGGPRGTLR
jgi:rod shape-determining protein MreB